VLGYAAINEQEILEGVRGLSAAFHEMQI